ncbi:PTS system mannose/fructose/sorbose family transporter subunit IID [Aerococcaceae bacterium WGS1372]
MGFVGYNNVKRGYHLGRESVTQLMQYGSMNRSISAASILGLFMMGDGGTIFCLGESEYSFSF